MYLCIILGVDPKTIREYAIITIYLLISRGKHSVWVASWKGWKKIICQILEPSRNPDMKGTLIKSNVLKSPNYFQMCCHLLIFRNKQISTLIEYITSRSFSDSIPLCSLRHIVWVFFSPSSAWTTPKWKLAHFKKPLTKVTKQAIKTNNDIYALCQIVVWFSEKLGADFLIEFEKWCFLRYFLELGEGVWFSQIASVVQWMSCEVLLPSCFFYCLWATGRLHFILSGNKWISSSNNVLMCTRQSAHLRL